MQKSLAGYSLCHIAEKLRTDVEMCRACPLGMQRQRVVFGQGKMSTDLMLIGEAPGAEEDEQGVAFVGKAGQLLTKILEAATISRDDIFITNVVKCRPPQNRNPSTDEVIACNKFLEAQIAIISPKIIVTLGNVPTRWFLKTSEGITSLRGRWFD